MSVETLEKNKIKLTFEVSPERFEEGMNHAYQTSRGKINIPGFRKGKAPRKVIEVQYGKEIFYDEAINYVLPDAYENAVRESGVKPVSRPSFDVEEVSTEAGVVVSAEMYVKPEVTVGSYKGLTYTPMDLMVTDEEVLEQLKSAQEKNARTITVTDRPVKDGDIATINFKGYIDDEPFQGGEGKDYKLTIGSRSFVDNFEEQLVGAKIGDDVMVNVTFPQDYHENLKGKDARFEVEIIDIEERELPELNDDFAQDISEYDTIDELKDNLRTQLEKNKEAGALAERDNTLLTQIIENSVMEVPDVMFRTQIDHAVYDFANNLRNQGMSMEMYLQFTGKTMEEIYELYRPNAEMTVKSRLVLETIAKIEELTVSEEDINEELVQLGERFEMDPEEFKKNLSEDDNQSLKEDILIRKAMDFVTENSVENH